MSEKEFLVIVQLKALVKCFISFTTFHVFGFSISFFSGH